VRLEEIGDLALKGLSQAVAVYNVVGRSLAPELAAGRLFDHRIQCHALYSVASAMPSACAAASMRLS